MRSAFSAMVLILFCGALSLGAGSCPIKDGDLFRPEKKTGGTDVLAGSTAPIAPPPQRVHDQRHRVSINVPADWTASRKNGNPFLFATAPGSDNNGPMVNLVYENISRRMDPLDYLTANLPTMQMSLPGLEVKESGIEPIGEGASTAWIHYTYPRGGEKIEALSYCQTRDYLAIVATCVSTEKMYPSQHALFRMIGRSLRLD